MTLKLHNTLSRTKEAFQPIDPDNIRMYACGPTVYDFAHIGNGRPVVVFDVLYRLLRHLYPKVTYVRNITDIDDKINQRARDSGQNIGEITKNTTQIFHDDVAAIGALEPDHEPRATEFVPQMIEMMKVLIDKGNAYVAEGHVLFNVPSMPEYGQLSGRNRDEQIDGARVDVAPYKRDPADFVLWKPSNEDTPGWESPWGRGRPGWHIECSAMSLAFLGETFDIHAGGIDLVFPHHENEIAQSRCAHGTDMMARYWMHNGYVTVEGEKMSKSLGNFYTINDLLADWPGEVIRYALLAGHYRAPLDYSKQGLAEAKSALDRLYQALRTSGADSGERELDPGVMATLCDDLNTPLAISRLHALAGEMNRGDASARSTLLASANLMGLLEADPEAWFQGGGADDEASWIEEKIEARLAARAAKDFATGDAIRDELKAKGIVLEDGAGGTTWKRG